MKLEMQKQAENAKMSKLYREVVLKETQPEGFVPLGNIAPAAAPPKVAAKPEEVGSFGD